MENKLALTFGSDTLTKDLHNAGIILANAIAALSHSKPAANSSLLRRLENYYYPVIKIVCLLVLLTSELGPATTNWGLCAVRLCLGSI
jgi:hypothetical protein